ncbi:hypothetical protein V8C86DRAFT_3029618 [Haematococcus lacustris]
MSPLHLALIFGVSAVGFALATDSGWQEGRGTWFDVQNGDLTTANCHLRWDQIRTGKNVGAFSDTHSMFRGSCGISTTYQCNCTDGTRGVSWVTNMMGAMVLDFLMLLYTAQNAVFKDGYGQNLDRSKACKDPNRSVYITIADACPCNYPNNQHSNKRWCCGDSSRTHIDITKEAFAELADVGQGVIAMQWRTVDCQSVSSGHGNYYPSSGSGSGSSSKWKSL